MTDPAIIDATAVATPAHLTAQNLDPNSRFFVPVELRPFYDKPDLMELRKLDRDTEHAFAIRLERTRLAADPDAWRAVLDQLAAGGMSRSDLRDMDERGPLRYRPPVDSVATLAARITDDDRFYWLHLRTLERAERAAPRAAEGRRAAEEKVRAETCQVCGVRVQREPGEYGRRIQIVTLYDHDARLAFRASGPDAARVCPECEPVLAAAIVERAAAATVNGRTRSALVADFLKGRNW